MAKLVYKRKNGTWEARYKKGKKADGRTHYASVIGHSYEEAVAKRLAVLGYDPDNPVATSEMNILILGAGSFGREVKEVLEQIRIFNKIAFLDDFITGEGILGKCTDASMFRINYACAFVAIGDSAIRRKYAEMLKEKHFLIPTIISPDAIVSPKAIIGMGSMVFAQGNVGAATVTAMQSTPAEIYASVGPGIRDCCYEVGDEVAETFLAMNEQISQYVTKKDGRYRLDLQSVVYTQLIQCGILPKHIDRCTFCTGCHTDPSFFSCRKDGKDVFEGQAAFICMK